MPKVLTKIILILLVGNMIFHAMFDNSKKYSFIYNDEKVNFASYDEYLICLNSLSYFEKVEFINSTDINYLYDYKENTYLIIYVTYFVLFSGLILVSKVKGSTYGSQQ